MLKSYEEMRKIDVTPFCEEREGMLYLNWAKCIDLLRENGAKKVYWEPVPDERTGSSLRTVSYTHLPRIVYAAVATSQQSKMGIISTHSLI